MASEDFEFLRTLTHDQAATYAGTVFNLQRDGEAPLELKLTSVDRLLPNRPRSPRMKRDPFSMFFNGPGEPLLPQGMYDLQSDAVTLKNLFIVPIGRNEDGTLDYEAVFT